MPDGITIITAALRELGVISSEETPQSPDSAWALLVLNRIVDQTNAKQRDLYVTAWAAYTFTTSAQSYTIGPSGADFTAPRPTEILYANLMRVASSPAERVPLRVIEISDVAEISSPAYAAEEPSVLYYQPTFPNGKLWPWPYPENTAAAKANQLELFTKTQFAAFDLTTNVNLPPGYEDFFTFELATKLAKSFGIQLTPELVEDRREARQTIQELNVASPKAASWDAGMPGSR